MGRRKALPINRNIARVALVVRDYDEAIDFYVGKLGFELVEDTYQPAQDKRWVVVRPVGDGNTSLLLARAASAPSGASWRRRSRTRKARLRPTVLTYPRSAGWKPAVRKIMITPFDFHFFSVRRVHGVN
jgi:catechol 2,3-dioxygenase-like lactoylglutathione lyase family enzyme